MEREFELSLGQWMADKYVYDGVQRANPTVA